MTTFVALGGAKEIETCDISCEISALTSDKKSRRKVNTSDHIVEVINSELKALAIWEQWQEWQPCSRTCGAGTRIRKGTCQSGINCTKGEPILDIQLCNGNSCGTSGELSYHLIADSTGMQGF
uniref:ADAMTS cysteine-rich domain-containing protein n=1 Tax=Wuchereria bancrofti TaxID=6293 RepID=A0A1I8EBD4_WUCBA